MKTPQFVVVAFSLSLLMTPGFARARAPETSLIANAVFRKNCAKCHGKTAAGRHFGGPSPVSAKTAAASADEQRKIMSNGKDRMPKFEAKLTSEEIDTLVEQIMAQNKK